MLRHLRDTGIRIYDLQTCLLVVYEYDRRILANIVFGVTVYTTFQTVSTATENAGNSTV